MSALPFQKQTEIVTIPKISLSRRADRGRLGVRIVGSLDLVVATLVLLLLFLLAVLVFLECRCTSTKVRFRNHGKESSNVGDTRPEPFSLATELNRFFLQSLATIQVAH